MTGDSDCSHENKRCLLPGRKAMTKPAINLRIHHFADKGPSSQSYGFSSSCSNDQRDGMGSKEV